MPAKRPSRFSSRRISTRSLRSVGASHFSIFLATCLAKPPPQRRDVLRTPSCILGATSDVGTVGLFLARSFLFRQAVARSRKAKPRAPNESEVAQILVINHISSTRV